MRIVSVFSVQVGLPSSLVSGFLLHFGLRLKQREAIQLTRQCEKDEVISVNPLPRPDYVFIDHTKNQVKK